MKLIYLGKSLDITKHHDLNSTNKFGFRVAVQYLPCERTNGERILEIWHNVNQIVHLYDDVNQIEYLYDTEHIAFESDLLETGGYRPLKDLESVVITLEDKMYPENEGTEYPDKN